MNTKQTNTNTEDIEARLWKVEKRVATLEKHVGIKVKRTRRTREYTPEERAAIRARLKTGQAAARKKREAEAKVDKKAENSDTKAVNLLQCLGILVLKYLVKINVKCEKLIQSTK